MNIEVSVGNFKNGKTKLHLKFFPFIVFSRPIGTAGGFPHGVISVVFSPLHHAPPRACIPLIRAIPLLILKGARLSSCGAASGRGATRLRIGVGTPRGRPSTPLRHERVLLRVAQNCGGCVHFSFMHAVNRFFGCN